jgi:hypothetical protein
VAEGGGLLNRYTVNPVSWVRIPSPPPPFAILQRVRIPKAILQTNTHTTLRRLGWRWVAACGRRHGPIATLAAASPRPNPSRAGPSANLAALSAPSRAAITPNALPSHLRPHPTSQTGWRPGGLSGRPRLTWAPENCEAQSFAEPENRSTKSETGTRNYTQKPPDLMPLPIHFALVSKRREIAGQWHKTLG